MPRLIFALLLFIAVTGLADLTGWGNGYTRLLALTLWFLIAAIKFTPRMWSIVWTVMIWASVPLAALAIAQRFYMPRPHSIFLSANVMGGYAVCMLFISLSRNYWVTPAIANFAALELSQSRGAFLALAAGLLCLAWKYSRLWASVVAGGIVCLVMYVTWDRGFSDPRLGIWHLAWTAAMLRPVLGWGEGGLAIGFTGLNSFYDIPLEILVASGLIGLAAGAWLYVEGVWAARGNPALLAFLAAWLVDGLFLFSTPATTIPLVTVLAWLASKQSLPRSPECRSFAPQQSWQTVGATAKPASSRKFHASSRV
jgi:hypothetical protein